MADPVPARHVGTGERRSHRLHSVFGAIHLIGTGRAGGAIRGRLRERGLAVTDGREPDPGAELVILDILCSNEVLGRQLNMEVFVLDRASGATISDRRVVTVVDDTPSPSCAGGG